MARNFTEFQELILLAEAFRNDAVNGKRLGAVSGAGFEAVGMADSIQSDEYSMSLGGSFKYDPLLRMPNVTVFKTDFSAKDFKL